MSRVLVILLNYRTAEMTLRAARAALDAMQGMAAELIVVDNDSRDGSEAKLRAGLADAPRARVIQSGQNGGFGAGNNIAMCAGLSDGTRPDYVYLLNTDAFPEPDAIRVLQAYLDRTPQAGIVGSLIYGEDGERHLSAFRFPTLWSELEGAARLGPVSRLLWRHVVPLEPLHQPTPVDWVSGASLMIRTEVLDRIGLFDERFFLYFEETELCLRAARAGIATHYVPESRVMHIGSVSTGKGRWSRVPAFWLNSRWHFFSLAYGRSYAARATVMHVLGGLLWRARITVERHRPRIDPPGFLRDMIAHDLRAALRPRPRPVPAPVPAPEPQRMPEPASLKEARK